MNQVIIFPNDSGGVTFCYPCECGLSIEQIARKDVPQGVPYLIVPDEQVPKDHTFFEAFEADFSEPHGYGDPAAYWVEQQARQAAEEARRAAAIEAAMKSAQQGDAE